MAPYHHAPHRRSERGLSILLSLLVLTVLIVVLFQVVRVSFVELDQAGYHVAAVQTRYLAEACRMQSESVLLMDIEDAGLEDEEGGGGGDPFGGLGDQAGGAAEDAANVTMSTDSLLDEWNNSTSLAPPMGEGLTIYVEIEDEDSKVNLLSLWTEDEDKREEWREILERLLDKAFEGTTYDFSSIDTSDILDSLDDWVKGDRSIFDEVPLPPLKLSSEEDEAILSEVDTDIIDNEERHFPLTIGELVQIEGITPEHVWGFVEDDVFYPGLARYLTVWSELELKEPDVDEDGEFSDSPFEGSVFDEDDDPEEEDQEIVAEPTAGGRVNVNTAPLIVLRAVAPEDIPMAFLERVIEFRERIFELRDAWEEALKDPDNSSVFDDEGEGDGEPGGEDETDPTYYVFQSENEVFDKVESEWDLSVFTDDADKSLFVSRLGVVSNVFTVKILLLNEQTDRRSTYRTILWRMTSGDEPRIITLLPLEEVADPRRMADYPEDLSDLAQERFEREDGRPYDLN
jgi:hypothetical protein